MADDTLREDIDDWLDDIQEDSPDDGHGQADEASLGIASTPAASSPGDQNTDEALDLSQSDIDALLGGGTETLTGDKGADGDDDALLGELTQAGIDDLFGGGEEALPDDNATGVEEDALPGELTQAGIDALLGGGEALPDDKGAGGDDDALSGELTQADIDALLGGGESSPPSVKAAGDGDMFSGELTQSDIDALLGGGEGTLEEAASEAVAEEMPDKDMIAKLIGDTDVETDDSLAREVTFAEILADGERESTPASDTAGASNEDRDIGKEEKTVLDTSFDDLPSYAGTDYDTVPSEEGREETFVAPRALHVVLANKYVIGAAALCILFVMGGGLYFKFMGEAVTEKKLVQETVEQAPAATEDLEGKDHVAVATEPVVEEITPVEEKEEVKINTAPVVSDVSVEMGEKSAEMPITLQGRDEDGDVLSYELVSMPKYGRLSGAAPDFVYLPNSDFRGEDSFEYRSTDGKEYGNTALVRISGPDLNPPPSPPPLVQPPEEAPAEPTSIAATDFTLKAKGADPIVIDWKKIWSQVNRSPFSGVSVEILKSPVHGKLRRTSETRHVYDPESYFHGRETLRYRFRQGGTLSGVRTVSLRVEYVDRPPRIQLASLEKSRQVGRTVTIDASATKDEDRNSVEFSWEQMEGVPVLLTVLNSEGSMVSFVMPSTFSRAATPGPVIRLTAIDRSNKKDTVEIRFTALSKHGSALWHGAPARREVVMESTGRSQESPGGGPLLPWNHPY